MRAVRTMSCALVSVALCGQEVVWERTWQSDATAIGSHA